MGVNRWGRLALAAGAGMAAYRVLQEVRGGSLKGQTVLVTGGSRGLGYLLAREFGRHGCKVAICARDERELEQARRSLRGEGFQVLAFVCNLADRDQAEQLIADATVLLGGIDILVNNAGVIQVGPLECMTVEDVEETMAVNFWGGVYATLAVLPQMRARGRGRIVNIDSIGGRLAVPHMMPYVSSKFAMRGFSEAITAELIKDGIQVTTVIPGLMRTGSPLNAWFKGDPRKEFMWFSLGDIQPLTAIDAERAARRIVGAARRGEIEVTLSWQAKLAGLVHDLLPSMTIELLGELNRLMPHAAAVPTPARLGRELPDAHQDGALKDLAAKTNQLSGEPAPSVAGGATGNAPGPLPER